MESDVYNSFEEYKKDIEEIIKGNPEPNLLIYKTREKNKQWNERIEKENLPLIKDFFNRMVKKMIIDDLGDKISDRYKNAAYYL